MPLFKKTIQQKLIESDDAKLNINLIQLKEKEDSAKRVANLALIKTIELIDAQIEKLENLTGVKSFNASSALQALQEQRKPLTLFNPDAKSHHPEQKSSQDISTATLRSRSRL